LYDEGEKRLEGSTFMLTSSAGGAAIYSDKSDANGIFAFVNNDFEPNLIYTIKEDLTGKDDGYVQTSYENGASFILKNNSINYESLSEQKLLYFGSRPVAPTIEVKKNADKSYYTVGSVVNFTLTVKNNGKSTYGNVKIIDSAFSLPQNGFSYVAPSTEDLDKNPELKPATNVSQASLQDHFKAYIRTTNDSSYRYSYADGAIEFEGLNTGEEAVIRYAVKFSENFAANIGTQFKNQTMVTAETATGESTKGIETNTVEASIIDIEKSIDKQVITSSETAGYTLEVTNKGRTDLMNIEIRDDKAFFEDPSAYTIEKISANTSVPDGAKQLKSFISEDDAKYMVLFFSEDPKRRTYAQDVAYTVNSVGQDHYMSFDEDFVLLPGEKIVVSYLLKFIASVSDTFKNTAEVLAKNKIGDVVRDYDSETLKIKYYLDLVKIVESYAKGDDEDTTFEIKVEIKQPNTPLVNASFDLRHTEYNQRYILVDPGTTYVVTEADSGKYTAAINGTPGFSQNGTITKDTLVQVVNTARPSQDEGRLVLKNIVEEFYGTDREDRTFEFNIVFTLPEGDRKTEAAATLSNGQTFTSDFYPYGTKFAVVEKDGKNYYVTYQSKDQTGVINGNTTYNVFNLAKDPPKTGDSSLTYIWLGIAVISILCGAGIFIFLKKSGRLNENQQNKES
jgi:uncharacterized repeat protein (TIGR01451 family)/LPXTG-motif cell wall-anchored protein